ncbi:hypothetical protein BDK51DRAFT_15535, partial [Blyttiomyces helicus]
PAHILILKVNVIVRGLRNLDSENGLCIGIRLQKAQLLVSSIKAKIIGDAFKATKYPH